MKKEKKNMRWKIVAALVVTTFVSVLTWHQMKNAHAYGTYDTGGNKHFVDGHLTVNMSGPNGKSDSLTMYMKKIKMSAVGNLIIPNIHIR